MNAKKREEKVVLDEVDEVDPASRFWTGLT